MDIGDEDGMVELKRDAGTSDNTIATYRVRRVALRSLGKFGCVLGALVGFVPSLIVAWGGVLAVGTLRGLLESWQGAGIHILGQKIPIDVVSLLNLEPLLRTVQQMGSLSLALVVLFVVVASLLAGVMVLVTAAVLGGVYNVIARFSGGLEVELKELPDRRSTKT